MIAQLVLMFSFLNTQNNVNPYWLNSEKMYFSYSAVTLSGQCYLDDSDYDDTYTYYVESDISLEFTLLSNNTDSYVLQLNKIYSTHYLYCENLNTPQFLYDDVTLNSGVLDVNYSQDDISDLADLGVNIEHDMEYSYISIQLLQDHTDITTSLYYASSDFNGAFTSSYTNFESFYTFDIRMVQTQLDEHLAKVYNSNYQRGYNDGYVYGIEVGEGRGYNTGYTQGYQDGSSQDEIATSIFVGILDIALLPINMFLRILNFEVFGINIGGFVSALLTIAIVVIIMRIVVSGGNKSDS